MSAVRMTAGIGALLVAGLVAACGGGGDHRSQQTSQDVHALHAAAAATPSPGASASTLPAPSSPAEAALRLESLVGQHSVLVADMMRARIRSDDDLAQAANAALTKNTQDMGTLLQPVIGADGVEQFAPMWSRHIAEFYNYARAVDDKDRKGQKAARAALVSAEQGLATFFVAGSNGRLDRKSALA